MLKSQTFCFFLTIVSLHCIFFLASSRAQDEKDDPKGSDDTVAAVQPLQYVAPKQIEMLIGIKLSPADQNMVSTVATTVFPAEWPEQKVEVLEVNVPPAFQHGFRDLPGGNKQLLFQAALLPARTTVEATIKVRVEKSQIVGPTETDQFVRPKRPGRDVKNYLGNSPYIETTSSEVKKIVREIDAKEPETEWKRVEMLYDWVRDKIVYTRGDLKSVKQAIKDKTGDCEEMTSTFVALCRAADVPARCVWIPGHCYPEFYLEDAEGNGYWFPCQAAGTRNFGSMPDNLPILQKGDRFKVPEDKELLRYLNDFVRSQERYGPGVAKPKVEFVRTLLGDAAKLPPPDQGAEQK
ncbi:MAG: transglutaminase-like domain-containing protein [Pirellulaceae bacterium]|nr:transglutaminase-like domain-containing protein [Pirellulaceae bacterium]